MSRRRGHVLEDAILAASWDVLREHGYAGFTYDAVAARAHTGRAVLYRRWPRREDLLLATIHELYAHRLPVPDTGSLRGDAIAFLRGADAGRARMVALIGVQIADFFRDTGTSFRELRDAIARPDEESAFVQIIARAVARGELRAEHRSPRVVELAFDLYRYEVFMTMRPVPARTIAAIVDDIWLPLISTRATTRAISPGSSRSSRPRPRGAPPSAASRGSRSRSRSSRRALAHG